MIPVLSVEKIAQYIDHTNVKADATRAQIKTLCEEAVEYHFHSVCVTPYRVREAKDFLAGAKVDIICVVGFPFGFTTTNEKINEARTAVADGATEIDMVANIGAIKEGNFDFIEAEIGRIAKAISPVGLKVIVEIGFLSPEELSECCRRAQRAGAAFVKTSTGYGPRTPTVEDIRIMRESVGKEMGVKASGGIHTFEQANKMISAGATRIGTSSALQIIGVETPPKKDLSGSQE